MADVVSTSQMIAEYPPDWHPDPAFLGRVRNPFLRLWAQQLNGLWQSLYRRVSPMVKDNATRVRVPAARQPPRAADPAAQFSLLYVENPCVLPGGRFMELYYWYGALATA